MTEEVKIEVIQPFSNLIYKIPMPENVTQGLIEHTDKMREDPNTPSFGQSLVGQVDEELELSDEELTEAVEDAVSELIEEGYDIDDIEDVFDLADRVVVMKNGAIVGSAQTGDVTKDEVLGMIILGKCPPGAIPGPGALAA